MVKTEKGYFFRLDWKDKKTKASRDSLLSLGGSDRLAMWEGNAVGMWEWAMLVKLKPGWSLSQFSFPKVLQTLIVVLTWGQLSGPYTMIASAPVCDVIIRQNCPELDRGLVCEVFFFLESKVAGGSGLCFIPVPAAWVKGTDPKMKQRCQPFVLHLVPLRLSKG